MVRIAYVEEPPFYWTENGSPTGADIELARVVFGAIGPVEFEPTTFAELLPGVQTGRWHANVPIFVTPERSKLVAFSEPVWALGDGIVVQSGNPKQLTGYAAIASRSDTRLGVIPGQVQIDAARSAGVADGQLASFSDQSTAIAALLAGEIDAFAATAVGNRVVVANSPGLESVELATPGAPVGAFSFRIGDDDLRDAVNAQLRAYLGTPDHRDRMLAYGITQAEIDGALYR